jgi:hypothetical protein
LITDCSCPALLLILLLSTLLPFVLAAVASGLASLATQDLTWDPQELSRGWPLLGDPLNRKDKIVSPGLYDKLQASGFSNHLQVGGMARGGVYMEKYRPLPYHQMRPT